jgi:hypothetical protein
MSPEELRLKLRAAGFAPIPVNGKRPRIDGWQKLTEVTEHDIRWWSRTRPAEENTGILTARTPVIDIDVLDVAAAEAAERLVREFLEEKGCILVRIGRFPKRGIPLRTDAPFPKIVVNFEVAPGAPEEKIEMLADGQQCVVAGVHPDTHQPYSWHGGSLDETKREELPYIHAEEARGLVSAVAALLAERFGYRVAEPKPRKRPNSAGDDSVPADWSFTLEQLSDHDSLAALAMRLVRSGMNAGACVNFLRTAVSNLAGIDEDRRQRRLREIPGIVDSAAEKIERGRAPPSAAEPQPLDQVVKTFLEWLALKDDSPVLVTLGAVAANMLEGDPVWLLLIAPSSNAKTALLDAVSHLPFVEPVETFTPAALLSGSPKRDKTKNSTGGVLRKIGDFGVIMFKDFGSVLDLRHEQRADMMTSLRRIYDGEYTRQLGTEGGKTIRWKGKAGAIGGSTQVYDNYHAVVGTLGDRFLIHRVEATADKQLEMCLLQTGAGGGHMRKRLSEAVAGLFAALPNPLPERANDEGRVRHAQGHHPRRHPPARRRRP